MDPKLNYFTLDEKVLFKAYDQPNKRIGIITEILFKFKDYWELKIKDVENGNIYCVTHSFLEDSLMRVDKPAKSVIFILEE